MRRGATFAVALVAMGLLRACVSASDVAPPSEDAGAVEGGGQDVVVSSADGAVDAAAPDARVPDATVLDTGAADSDATLVDAGGDTNLTDAAIVDAAADAMDAADSSDAADADTDGPIPCAPIADIDEVFYSRTASLSDGGAATLDGSTTPYGVMWVARGSGTSDAPFAAGHWPRLSPDRRSVLYQTGSTDFTAGSLYVHDLSSDAGADGAAGDTFIYSSSPDHIVGWTWTPDSASVVFDYYTQTNEVARDGSNPRLLYTYYDGYSDAPQASPQTGAIVFHSIHFGLGLVNADGTSAHTIPNTAIGDFFPTWTPDGQWIVFVHQGGTISFGIQNATVFKIKPDGSGRTPLTPALAPGDGFIVQGGTVTADSAKYLSVATVRGVSSVYAVPLDGSATYERLCTTDGPVIDFVGGVTGAASDAGADGGSFAWVYTRIGDCPGSDVSGSTGTDVPVAADCDGAHAGLTAVCWDGTNYTNTGLGSQAGCTYKSVASPACTGGTNPGYLYTCLGQ